MKFWISFVILLLYSCSFGQGTPNLKHPAPILVASFEPFCFGDSTHFINKTSPFMNFEWNIQNSNGDTVYTSTEYQPSYLFETIDTFTVTITANNGHIVSKTIELIINGNTHADFDFVTCFNDSVALSSHSVCATYVRWEFEDGTSSNQHNFLKRFQNPGFHSVLLIAYNQDSSQIDTISRKIDIPVPFTPEPNFTIEHHYFDTYDSVVFTPETLTGQVYMWFYGDGTSTNNSIITHHIYPRDTVNDTLEVLLQIVDVCGFKIRRENIVIYKQGYPVGIKQNIPDAEIKVFPNPTNDQLFISSSQIIERVELIDLSGKVFLEQNFPHDSIYLEHIPSGIYIIKVISKENLSTSKVIIQH